MEQEKIYLIKQSDVQKVIDYLVKRPYVEVHQLIPILFNLKEGIEKPNQKQDKGKD